MAAKPKPSRVDEVIGRNVRRRREELGASQDDVARALAARGWAASGGLLSAVEDGRRSVRVEELLRLAQVLNVEALLLLEVPADSPPVDLGWDRYGGRELGFVIARSDNSLPNRWTDLEERRLAQLQFSKGGSGHGQSFFDSAVGEAERHAARRLGIPATEVVERSRRLWHRTLTSERNDRAARSVEPGASERRQATIRAHVTRELLEELRADIDKEGQG